MRIIQHFVVAALTVVAVLSWTTRNASAEATPRNSAPPRLIDVFSPQPAANPEKIAAFLEKMRAAIDNGADVNAADQYGSNPLLVATYWAAWSDAKSGFNDIVAFLLSRGANPNVADSKGTTPLVYVATGVVNSRLVELLCAAGADPRVKSPPSGVSPLEMSRSNSFPQIAKAMEACAPKQ